MQDCANRQTHARTNTTVVSIKTYQQELSTALSESSHSSHFVTVVAAAVDDEMYAERCRHLMATTEAARELAFTFAVAIFILLIEYPSLTHRINYNFWQDGLTIFQVFSLFINNLLKF